MSASPDAERSVRMRFRTYLAAERRRTRVARSLLVGHAVELAAAGIKVHRVEADKLGALPELQDGTEVRSVGVQHQDHS